MISQVQIQKMLEIIETLDYLAALCEVEECNLGASYIDRATSDLQWAYRSMIEHNEA